MEWQSQDKIEVLDENLSQCHIVHHNPQIPHREDKTETRSPRWLEGNRNNQDSDNSSGAIFDQSNGCDRLIKSDHLKLLVHFKMCQQMH